MFLLKGGAMMPKRWIVPLMLVFMVCGSVGVRADNWLENDDCIVVDKKGYRPCTDPAGHNYFETAYASVKVNDTYHEGIAECGYCGDERRCRFYHEYCELEGRKYRKVNRKYHEGTAVCNGCGDRKKVRLLHDYGDFEDDDFIKATPEKPGQKAWRCAYCHYLEKGAKFKWKYHGRYCVNYDITDHDRIYENSGSVTVTLKNALKGAVLKVRIGSKKYTKKLMSGRVRKIRVPIGHSLCKSRIKITLTYKNRVIGKDKCKKEDRKNVVW